MYAEQQIIDNLEGIFKQLDKNNDGSLQYQEIKQGFMLNLGDFMTEDEFE
jgi:Ca2+-binding EF-hand superfamily protein